MPPLQHVVYVSPARTHSAMSIFVRARIAEDSLEGIWWADGYTEGYSFEGVRQRDEEQVRVCVVRGVARSGAL
jgi:hypothetical protein